MAVLKLPGACSGASAEKGQEAYLFSVWGGSPQGWTAQVKTCLWALALPFLAMIPKSKREDLSLMEFSTGEGSGEQTVWKIVSFFNLF